MKVNNPHWELLQQSIIKNDPQHVQDELRTKVNEFNKKLLNICHDELVKKMQYFEKKEVEIKHCSSKKESRELYKDMIDFHRKCKNFSDSVRDLKEHIRDVSLGKIEIKKVVK